MAAQSINVFALQYSYPQSGQQAIDSPLQSPSFTFMTSPSHFQVLSSNTATSTDVEGLFFVPTYQPSDACYNISAQYVPKNVTTLQQLPSNSEFSQIAFGPWTNASCVMEALDIANMQSARAFVTYLPGRNNSNDYQSANPPNASDAAWDLGDNGAWKNKFGFPVYALNSNDGTLILDQLSKYSGNITSAPYGSTLVTEFGPSTTVRLYMQANVSASSTLPSLWVFLLIVVAILVGVLLVASVVMRFVQRRRRLELARLVANGTVNLESLGISRVKVTPEVLEKMPLSIYVNHGETPGPPHAPPVEPADQGTATDAAEGQGRGGNKASNGISAALGRFTSWRKPKTPPTAARSGLPAIMEEKAVSFPQDTCVICLDEFENHVTPVRTLPCGHAFHPACIDPLLLEYSSLCPTCKQSVLPKDYVPEITNIMVRRERLMRRIRDLEARESAAQQRALAQGVPAHFRGIARFMNRPHNANERAAQDAATANNNNTTTTPAATTVAAGAAAAITPAIELQPVSTTTAGNGPTSPTSPRRPRVSRNITSASAIDGARRPENVSREEWARRRAAALVGTTETVEEAEQREVARLPVWRRALGPIFPTLRS